MRRRFLKEHRKPFYYTLLTQGKLLPHLEEIEQLCSIQIEAAVRATMRHEHLTEAFKAAAPLAWAHRCNALRAIVEDLIVRRYVYDEEVV